jgi:hypothetical protein
MPWWGIGDANVFFKPGMKGQKYEKYREAWDLLLDAARGESAGPIDIHASCDDRDAGHAGELMPPSAVRKMFREAFRM